MFSIIMYKTTLLLGIPHNIRTCAIVVRVSTGGLRMILEFSPGTLSRVIINLSSASSTKSYNNAHSLAASCGTRIKKGMNRRLHNP